MNKIKSARIFKMKATITRLWGNNYLFFQDPKLISIEDVFWYSVVEKLWNIFPSTYSFGIKYEYVKEFGKFQYEIACFRAQNEKEKVIPLEVNIFELYQLLIHTYPMLGLTINSSFLNCEIWKNQIKYPLRIIHGVTTISQMLALTPCWPFVSYAV